MARVAFLRTVCMCCATADMLRGVGAFVLLRRPRAHTDPLRRGEAAGNRDQRLLGAHTALLRVRGAHAKQPHLGVHVSCRLFLFIFGDLGT